MERRTSRSYDRKRQRPSPAPLLSLPDHQSHVMNGASPCAGTIHLFSLFLFFLSLDYPIPTQLLDSTKTTKTFRIIVLSVVCWHLLQRPMRNHFRTPVDATQRQSVDRKRQPMVVTIHHHGPSPGHLVDPRLLVLSLMLKIRQG